MKLTDVDLNLLVVFHHLMRERGVSRTADALGLSQPAVSNALARLRRLLGDELFLRTATGHGPHRPTHRSWPAPWPRHWRRCMAP